MNSNHLQQIQTFEAYQTTYAKSCENPEAFWSEIAQSFLWKKTWNKVLNWDFKTAEITWFDGAALNITENCIDRHLANDSGKIAMIWEPNNPTEAARKISYGELASEVNLLSNVLTELGVLKGDRVCIYMPMIPEAAFAMLACARIGAIHSVVFAGFSAQALADRIIDAGCVAVLTADGMFRGEKKIELKKIVDEALLQTPSVQKCLVYQHRNFDINMEVGRDFDWCSLTANAATHFNAVSVDSEAPLFVLYTSGSTGKPKGILHTTAGYMVYAAYTFLNVFQYKPGDVFCCTADIGWITGHSYVLYGPLLNGGTTVLFEGIPNYPDAGRFWDLIDKHKVSIFYTAPTAIRSLELYGKAPFEGKNLSSLKVLGSVGEPINEDAWQWYFENVGKMNCPIVDTWWQTETGGIMISPLAGITPLKPAFATLPLPGIQLAIVDDKGNELYGNDVAGNLCIRYPWPGMARSIYGNHERFIQTYFSIYSGMYFTGDGCKRDEDGYIRITGRVDDVINVSGHRIGTGEVEDALNEKGFVVESAVVGYPHHIKGQGIWAFVICEQADIDYETLCNELRQHVSVSIGGFARPDVIQVVKGLPKTRSGKIMRRILRKIAEGETNAFGDITTLLDSSVVEQIIEGAQVFLRQKS